MPASWSRRRFLATVAGSAAATQFVSRLSAAEAGKYGPFLMGIQSYTFRSFPTDKALDTMQSLGIQTVEFFDAHYSSRSNAEQIAAMNKKLAAHDLKILSHGVHGFSKNHEENRRFFEFAKAAGIRNLTADPSEDSFDSLDKLVAEYDVRIAIHNHGPGARYDKVESVLNAVKGRHKNIGACADLGHYIRSGEDPVKVITLLEGRLFGVHLKDFEAPRGNAKGCILGKGVMDVPAVLTAIKRVGLPDDACLALEYEENASDPTADVKECLQAAADGAKKAFG